MRVLLGVAVLALLPYHSFAIGFSGDYSASTTTAVFDGGDDDRAQGIVVDNSGSSTTYVVGYSSFGAQDHDWILVKYDADGVLLASTTFDSGFGQDWPLSIAGTSGGLLVGGFIAGGQRTLIEFDPTTLSISNSFSADSGVFTGVLEHSALRWAASVTNGQLTLNGFNSSFDPVSMTTATVAGAYGPDAQINNLATDGTNLFIAGINTTNNSLVVASYNTSLVLQSSRTIAEAEFFGGVTIDTDGSSEIFVTAVSSVAGPTAITHLYRLSSLDLTTQSSATVNASGNAFSSDERALQVIPGFGVFLSGSGPFPGLVRFCMDLSCESFFSTGHPTNGFQILDSSNVYMTVVNEGSDFQSARLNLQDLGSGGGGGGGGGAFVSLAFDENSGNLFAADYRQDSVRQYNTPVSTAIHENDATNGTIAANSALAVEFDAGANLWVSIGSASAVAADQLVRFPSSGVGTVSGTSDTTLSALLRDVHAVAFQPDTGDMWVANGTGVLGQPSIVKFARGGSIAAPLYTDAGASTFTFVNSLPAPVGLAFDSNDNLWVADELLGGIYRFPNSGGTISTSSNAAIVSLAKPYALAFDIDGNMFVTSADADSPTPGSGEVYFFRNIGSLFAPAFAASGELVDSGSDLLDLAFDFGTGRLWGADFLAGKLVQVSTSAPTHFGTISGILSYTGAKTGPYFIAPSTDPFKVFEPPAQVSSGAYVLSNLKAPATYYVRAFLDHDLSGGEPGNFDPIGFYGSSITLAPVFVAPNATATAVNFSVRDTFRIEGTVTNGSNQTGGLIVEAWSGLPNDGAPELILERRGFSDGVSTYSVFLPTGTNIVLRAFIDGNQDGAHQPVEDFGLSSYTIVNLLADTTSIADISISSSAGGSMFFAAVDLAPATLPTDVFDLPLLKLGLWAEGGAAEFSRLRVGFAGDAPSGSVQAKIYQDSNGDQTFQSGADQFLGSRFFGAGVPPSADVEFSTRAINATTSYFFISVSYPNGAVPAGRELGFVIDDASDFNMVSGSIGNGIEDFPIFSGLALVSQSLFAKPQDQPGGGYQTPTNAPAGGFDTGLPVAQGQKIVISGDGFWNSGAGSTDADGTGATGGLGASLNIGALVARIGNSPWFQVGVSSTVDAANAGTLFLAMNDSDYSDNAGQISVNYKVQASSAVVVWNPMVGNNADIAANWQGGVAPKTGERVLLDGGVSNADINWNIFGLELGLLTMDPSYTGSFTLVGSNNPDDYNVLTVTSHVYVRGGKLNLGRNSDFNVTGRVSVDGGTLDMGFDQNHLRVGAAGVLVSGGGFFRSRAGGTGFVSIEPISPGVFPSFSILDATVTIGGNAHLQFDDSRGVVISSLAAINSLSTITWQNFGYNPYPALVLARPAPTALTLQSLEFRVDTSTNVDATGIPAGSTITVLNAIGSRRGSPFENDPNGVVVWNPDGGGQAFFSGTLTNGGTGSGSYYVRAWGGGSNDFGPEMTISTTPGAFSFPPLDAPATWYFTAWRSTTTPPELAEFAPRGGDGIPGRTRSRALFVSPNDSVSDIAITIEDWGRVAGVVTNNSTQFGPIRVQAWNGDPTTQGPEVESSRSSLPGDGGPYDLSVPATGLYLLAFVDVNNNKAFDSAFEAFGTSAVVTGIANALHTGADITITGGSAVAGGTGTVTGTAVHPGFIADSGDNPMLRLEVMATGSSITLSALRVDFDGPVAPGFPYEIRAYRDANNDGTFQEPIFSGTGVTGDLPIGGAFVDGGVSTATIVLFEPLEIASPSTATLFIGLDLFGQHGVSSAALRIATSGYFGMSQGEMFPQAGAYPVDSGAASVNFAVPAFEFVTPTDGGKPTGFHVDPGLTVSIESTGTWSYNASNTVTPAGKAGTIGQNTILPDARRGELIGRIGPSPWFRVGTGTVFTSEFFGDLFLAMNDFDGDYNDNSGRVFARFELSGSTIVAMSGTIGYTGGNTGPMFVRAIQDCGPAPAGCQPIVSTTVVTLSGGTTSYPYALQLPFPGFFEVDAYVDADPNQKGGTFHPVQTVSGSTTTGQDFVMSLGVGTITGSLSYSGVLDFGSFVIVASTSPDFEKDPLIVAETLQTTTGAFTLGDLPTPNTFYIVAFRDGNFNMNPDGPEPFGVHGDSSGSISDLSALFTPIFVDNGATAANRDISLFDKSSITGDLVFEQALNNESVVIIAGRGQFGSPQFQFENREFQFPGQIPAGGSVFYGVGLLRPATDYSVFAFVDSDGDESYDSGERFGGSASLFTIPAGGGANVNLVVRGATVPAAVSNFVGLALSPTEVLWTWNTTPGATAYHLLTSTEGVRETLGANATSFSDLLTPNAFSEITGIRALNALGAGSSVTVQAVGSLAAVPGQPVASAFISSAIVSWDGVGNQPGDTIYHLERSIAETGPFVFVASPTVAGATDISLSPQSTYYYRVRALNLNAVFSAYSATNSVVTGAASAPSVAGRLTYSGGQRGPIILQAFTSSNPLAGLENFVTLPFSPDQSYFLPVSGGQSYFLHAFVNVLTSNQIADPGEDAGIFGSAIAVGGGPSAGNDFSIQVDTVAPGSPSGVVPTAELRRTALVWGAPSLDGDGGPLDDLAGFRVQRTTSTSLPFKTITHEFMLGGATGLVVTGNFVDTAPVAGIDNFYRIIAVDFGNNESVPSGVVVARPSGGGTISGSVSTFTATTSGAFRIRLSSLPVGSSYLAESTLNPYSFTGLDDGTYYVRGFRDTNSNSAFNAGEPAGTHGGIVAPFPIQILGGNTASGRNVVICDQSAITANGNVVFGDLSATDCPALDRGPGRRTDLYRFTVGGGAAGSLGVGSRVQAEMFSPAFGPDLILVGPQGGVIASDNNPGGAFVEVDLNEAGVYTLEPTSFDPNRTGPYDLSLRVVGGFAGQIAGVTNYSGGAGGNVHLQLFDSTSTTNAFPFFIKTEPSIGAFTISGLPDGTFFLRAFRDGNGNSVKDANEPSGQYGISASSLTALRIQGGVLQNSGVSVTLSDPAVGAVSGTLTRQGTKTGTIRVEIGPRSCSDCGDIDVVQFATLSAAGAYTLPFIAPATNYILRAYVDENGNRAPDVLEARVSSNPVTVTAESTTTVNLLLKDPGLGSTGNSVIAATVSYTGSSTGSVFIGIATDPEIENILYIKTLTSTGSFTQSVIGNTSYYIGAFIDTNGNGTPEFEGDFKEPIGLYDSNDDGAPDPIFVPLSSSVAAGTFLLYDPPNGAVSGTATYAGAALGDLLLEASAEGNGEGFWNQVRLARTVGVSTYSYTIPFLAANANFRVRGFVDSNGNNRSDFGEPFFERQSPISVSSGTSVGATTGINVVIFDAGAGGAAGEVGELAGNITYNGGQPGPVVVQAFTTSTFVGNPRFQKNATGGPAVFQFSIANVPPGDYFLRAFKDGNNDSFFAPSFEASGFVNAGSTVTVSADNPIRSDLSGTLTDVGSAAGGGANDLSGSVEYRGVSASTGPVQVMLFEAGRDIPVRVTTIPFAAGALPYTFDGLDTGLYFVRGFVDYNNNRLPDSAEAFGQGGFDGVFLQGPAGGIDFDLCDRDPLTTAPPGLTNGTLSVSDCRSSDESGSGRQFQDKYFFAGSRGQLVSLTLNATGFTGFGSELELLGPKGDALYSAVALSGDGNARIVNFPLPESGVYTIVAKSVSGGVTGGYQLQFQGSAGDLGSIAGEVSYTGSQGGQVIVALFNQSDFDQEGAFLGARSLSGPGAFLFDSLATGASYYLGAFIDVNFDFEIQEGEDSGQFGGETATPVFLRAGQSVTGLTFSIAATTATTGFAGVTGRISYDGLRAGQVIVEFWPDPSFSGRPIASRRIPTGVGPYDASLPGDQPYFVRAFIDADDDFLPDPDEPQGVYSPSGQGAEPVFVPASGQLTGIDFTLFDPFKKQGQTAAAGQGTATLAMSSTTAGSSIPSLSVDYLVGSEGISATGLITFGVPPGFPFPQAGAGPGQVTVTPGASFNLEFPAGIPAVGARATANIAAGSTVTFTYSNFTVPCDRLGTQTFFMGSASSGTTNTEPLFNGQPSLAVNPGSAEFFRARNAFFSLTQNATSQALVLEGFDRCDNVATATGTIHVTLTGKRFDPTTGVFPTAASLLVSTGTNVTMTNSAIASFAAGRSSATFFARGSQPGPFNVKFAWNVAGPEVSYTAVDVLPTNVLTGVSVSTVPFGLGKTSATIVPNGDVSTPEAAFINFTLSDPSLSWRVLISSLPLRTGTAPTPIQEFGGQGQPALGQIAWDGRFARHIQNGARVPSGLYYVRVDVGGGVTNDSLLVKVVSSKLDGTVFDAGTTPNLPLSGVIVDAFGRLGGGSVLSDSLGRFSFGGLAPGGYRLNFLKANYLIGGASVTIDSSGLIAAFGAAENVTLSSTTAGALKVLLQRSPSLVIVPTLQAGSTQEFELWGDLQVANASSTFVQNRPLHLPAGTMTFDDGGQWDPSLGRFVAKQFIRFEVPADTYTITAHLGGFDAVTTSGVFVASGRRTITLPPFARRPAIRAWVELPSPAFNTDGVFVSVNAIPLSTAATVSGGFGDHYFPPTYFSAVVTIPDMPSGDFRLFANAEGLKTVQIDSVTIAAVDVSTAFPKFADPALANLITGTVTVNGDTLGFLALDGGTGPDMRVQISAWSPGTRNQGFATVPLTKNATTTKSTFTITGLDPGVEYQIFAFLDRNGDGEFGSPGGFPKRVTISTSAPNKNPEGSLDFSFDAASGTIQGVIFLPAGQFDFGSVSMFGETIASARPESVGERFGVDKSTELPGFTCGDGNNANADALGTCAVSQASFTVTGLDSQTIDIEFLYRTTGRTAKRRISVVNGGMTTATVDLRDATFSISGLIVNQITDTGFNTNPKLVDNSALVPLKTRTGGAVTLPPLTDVPVSTASLARVIAVRQDFNTFSVGVSTSFDPANDRVGFIQTGGTFTIRNVPAGVYLLRTENLRLCATCAVAVPESRSIVTVTNADLVGSSIALTSGFSVSGSISLENSISDARTLALALRNSRQEVVRSTRILLGNPGTGQNSNSVAYGFANLPAGQFYTLSVVDSSAAPKYIGAPIRFPDAASSPNGLSGNLISQNLTLKVGAFVTGKLKDANTGSLIREANAKLLAPNFQITATANPWVEGGFAIAPSSVQARPILADGTWKVGPLFPGIPYDIRLGQTKWDLAFLANGSQNYAPVTLAGQIMQSSEIKDAGTIGLAQGQSIKGTIVNAASTHTALGNIKVVSRPSFGTSDVRVETYSNGAGAFTIWVSTEVSAQYDIQFAPRDGNLASDGFRYSTLDLRTVEVTTAPLAIRLNQLLGSVTAQITTADGGALGYPFGDQKGFPAAAVFMQKAGVVALTNPFGDVEELTDGAGGFTVPGLSTGTYVLQAVSLGYNVAKATVVVTPNSFCISTTSNIGACTTNVTLQRGAQATGRILLPDGSAPSNREVGGVAAATRDFKEFLPGTVEYDPTAQTVKSYTISGFKTGLVYDLVILPQQGDDIYTPNEGQGISFSSAESTTTKTINLTYSRPKPDCVADHKALGNNQFLVKFECSQPMRNKITADSDLSRIITIATATASGAALIAPNGTGAMLGSDYRLASTRSRFQGIYRAAAGESQYSIKLLATMATIDNATGDNFILEKTFDFFTGLESAKKDKCPNMKTCELKLEPTQEDTNLGRNEKFSVNIPPGSFTKCAAGDVGCTVDPGQAGTNDTQLNPQVEVRRARSREQASAQYLRAYGYTPQHLATRNDRESIPGELGMAIANYKTLASTNVNAASAFYDIFLPLGIRTQLTKEVDLTFSYQLPSSTTPVNDLNVWHFNTTTGKFEIENTNRRVDAQNETVTVTVDHFSTFVVLASTPIVTSNSPFGGGDIDVFNFPNPFDCTGKTKSLNNRVTNTGSVSFNGTLIRFSLPTGQTAEAKFRIYNVAGELVREFSQGSLAGGFTYYSPWDCRNQGGVNVASGIYIGQLEWGGKSKFFKMALIKGSGL